MRILIIKLGYSETLDREIGKIPSLGDVLRTTVILNYFKNSEVTWLVDEKAYPLLKGNTLIKRVMIFGQESIAKLQRERFDTIINFEKELSICAFSGSLSARKRFGFRFDSGKSVAQAYGLAGKDLNSCLDIKKKKKNVGFWQDMLARMINEKWSKREEYILGYQPVSKEKYDIGFNWAVGEKWPNKAWPKKNWKELEKLLQNKYNICWQKGLGNLEEYMDWINSCRLIVTNDSLGMHLGIVLRKKLIVLFGPSLAKEVCLYGRGIKLLSKTPYKCVPCLSPSCTQKVNCMEYIKPEEVKGQILKMFSGKSN